MKIRNIRKEDRKRGERKKWASFKQLAPHEQCSHEESWVWFLFFIVFYFVFYCVLLEHIQSKNIKHV